MTKEEVEKENKELKEKLTAIRKAKDKYDMSKNKSIISACGAEYYLFCDLERILEDWQEDNKLTEAKEIMKIAIEGIKHWGIIGGMERPFEKLAELEFNLFLEKAEQFLNSEVDK